MMTLVCEAADQLMCTVSCKRYRDGAGDECPSIPSSTIARDGRAPRVVSSKSVKVGTPWITPRPPTLYVEQFAIGCLLASWDGAKAERFNVYAAVDDPNFVHAQAHLVHVAERTNTDVGSVVIARIDDKPLPEGKLVWVAVHAVHPIFGEGPSSNVVGTVPRPADDALAAVATLPEGYAPAETFSVDETHVWRGDAKVQGDRVMLGFDGSRIIDSGTARERAMAVIGRMESGRVHVDPIPFEHTPLHATNFKMSEMVKELAEAYVRPTFFNRPIGEDADGTPVFWSDLVDENIAPADVRITL